EELAGGCGGGGWRGGDSRSPALPRRWPSGQEPSLAIVHERDLWAGEATVGRRQRSLLPAATRITRPEQRDGTNQPPYDVVAGHTQLGGRWKWDRGGRGHHAWQ